MIDRVFFEHVKALPLAAGYNLFYGSAEHQTPPYVVMFKVTDQERPFVLCNEQGESGKALFQFSGYMGEDAANTVYWLETLKRVVALVEGIIGTDTRYRIHNNITGGVVVLNDGASSVGIWGAYFETEIWWEIVSEET